MPVDQPSTRAVQYVRMSTEKQVYSIANQMAKITDYAQLNGFEIVETYRDEGCSGLHLKGRLALQQLLSDVLAKDRGFDAILIYDVSRWGRFQDTDESAHYEFICRSAGVQVHYCAELFENDGSLASTIIKNVRRAMAGEFSRDLSDKVFAAQCRLASNGHKMGGRPPYGMRRVLLDEHGNLKGALESGQVKNLRSDRVALVPGPAREVQMVRRIFRLSADKLLLDCEIVRLLNAEGSTGPTGGAWSRSMISHILQSERYLGTNVFNQSSSKLRGGSRRNSRDAWIRCEGAFEPIISRRLFDRAQRARGRVLHIYQEDELTSRLQTLLEREGKLSGAIIQRSKDVPSVSTYRKRFGSLPAVYRLVDFQIGEFSHVSVGRGMVRHALELFGQARAAIRGDGGGVSELPGRRLLHIDGDLLLGVTVARYIKSAEPFWRVSYRAGPEVGAMLVGLMDPANQLVQRLYLIPAARIPKCGKTCFTEGGHRMEEYRIENIACLYAAINARLR